MKKIYKFSANWCGPCKMLSKTLASIESPIEIEEIDIDQNVELSQQHRVRGVPTLILIEDNKEIKRKVGVMSAEEFLKWVNN